MGPLNDASFRRFVMGITAILVAAGNKKLGLELSPTEVVSILSTAVGYIFASNTKEATIARANAAAKTAADTVVPSEETDAKFEALKRGEQP